MSCSSLSTMTAMGTMGVRRCSRVTFPLFPFQASYGVAHVISGTLELSTAVASFSVRLSSLSYRASPCPHPSVSTSMPRRRGPKPARAVAMPTRGKHKGSSKMTAWNKRADIPLDDEEQCEWLTKYRMLRSPRYLLSPTYSSPIS